MSVAEERSPPSEEVTEAACSLICDWAERILKRSFDTVVEIARFLIQEHIVNPRSSTAHIIMSASLAENPARPDKRPRIEEESSSAQRTKRKKSEADNMHFFSQIQIPASPKSAARRQRNGTSQQNLGTACPSPLTLLPREPVVPIVTGNTPLTREPAVPIITGNSPLTPQQHPLPTRSRASLPCSETAAGIHHPTGGLRDCEAQSWACEGWATQWRSRDPTEAGSEEPEHERTGNLPPPCGRELSDIIEVIIQDDRGAGALRPASAGNTEAAQRETIDLTAESP
ncbi:DNA-binding protein RFX5-like isoform X4 [Acipenser ruthenus]|uniref:DNA-binding protein RFX5-like isoform X4 n=1 Tax=Acipenser ruthenus TaxID=7906 RepID=UPI0027421C6D|nr:DNA-binding protein RFX5-like isoform X4 [Acipenser ruthenus]